MKYSIGYAALGLQVPILGTLQRALAAGPGLPMIGNASNRNTVPSYPIAADIHTTLDKMVIPLPQGPKTLLPRQVSEYAPNHYGEWEWGGAGFPFLRPDMQTGEAEPSVRDPFAATLLSFFTMSDIHITDKESPALCIYLGYTFPEPSTADGPAGNSSAYSAVMVSTTHVLDAAVQTINALHKEAPFDFGIALGDAANNTQHNELRWYIDVLDGQMITPSSGAHHGATTVEYQKPYQAAGLDKSIAWYQVIGNHDQFWMGSAPMNNYLRDTLVGSGILNLGPMTSLPPDWPTVMSGRGLYMGVVDGSTKYGDVIDAGPVGNFNPAPQIVADSERRSLSLREWMSEFSNTTSTPVGHGFTQSMIDEGFACYHFHPKADIPIKVIVLDDTDKVGGGAAAALDYKRYEWLVHELDEGEAAGELMIICAHIPIRPYAQVLNNPPYALESLFAPYSDISEDTLLAKLHTYRNLILWLSGHIHRNTITPQPSPNGDPEYGFWEVETPSLRDLPQQFRRLEIVRNGDNTISIFALDVDHAANSAPLADGSASPAWTSRSYAIATQQIFANQVAQGPHVDPSSGVYNAELVKQLSPEMQAKVAGISPVVSSLRISSDFLASYRRRIVTLNNTVVGSTPTHFMASEYPSFEGALWRPYSRNPSFALRANRGTGPGGTTGPVYFRVNTSQKKLNGVSRAGFFFDKDFENPWR